MKSYRLIGSRKVRKSTGVSHGLIVFCPWTIRQRIRAGVKIAWFHGNAIGMGEVSKASVAMSTAPETASGGIGCPDERNVKLGICGTVSSMYGASPPSRSGLMYVPSLY